MAKKITIIQGHPDPAENRFCHALADAYAAGAKATGHEVRRISAAKVDFPILRTYDEFYKGTAPPVILPCQEAVGWADHLVILYPLWLGTMPALLKAFFEQLFRPGFAFTEPESGQMWHKLLTGKSCRIVVTMGMPAFVYRWYFFAHGLRSLERNILGFAGIGPIRESLIGMIGDMSADKRQKWLDEMTKLGGRAL
jgi:putative NADPH-quinone reductase